MTVHVKITTVFFVRTADPESLFDHADVVMEELLALEDENNIMDSAVSVDRGLQQVTIELVGCGADGMEAILHGVTAMRSAIHGAGGATPRWPTDLNDWDVIEQTSSAPQLLDA